MNHCKDCKHFDHSEHAKPRDGFCTRDEKPDCLYDALGDQGALVVMAEFGCVQFEPKEQG